MLRSDRELPSSVKAKISSTCDVDLDAVVSCADASSIYEIPLVLHGEGLDAYAIRRLDLLSHDVDWGTWEALLERVRHPLDEVTVAVVGKYIDLPDAYLSVTEALRAGGFHHSARVHLRWVESDLCSTEDGARAQLGDVEAVVVPGGFGIRGVDGKVGALSYARRHGIPTLGLCLGMQSMVIEYARHEPRSGRRALHRIRAPGPRTRSSRRWPSRRMLSLESPTSAGRCVWASYQHALRAASSPLAPTAARRSPSGTGIASR